MADDVSCPECGAVTDGEGARCTHCGTDVDPAAPDTDGTAAPRDFDLSLDDLPTDQTESTTPDPAGAEPDPPPDTLGEASSVSSLVTRDDVPEAISFGCYFTAVLILCLPIVAVSLEQSPMLSDQLRVLARLEVAALVVAAPIAAFGYWVGKRGPTTAG